MLSTFLYCLVGVCLLVNAKSIDKTAEVKANAATDKAEGKSKFEWNLDDEVEKRETSDDKEKENLEENDVPWDEFNLEDNDIQGLEKKDVDETEDKPVENTVDDAETNEAEDSSDEVAKFPWDEVALEKLANQQE